MNIELTADTTKIIESLVSNGQYASASEAVAEGMRLVVARYQLKSEIQQGIDELDAGLGISGSEVFANLRERNKSFNPPRENLKFRSLTQ